MLKNFIARAMTWVTTTSTTTTSNNNTKIYNVRIPKYEARIGGAGSHQVTRRSVLLLIVNELDY